MTPPSDSPGCICARNYDCPVHGIPRPAPSSGGASDERQAVWKAIGYAHEHGSGCGCRGCADVFARLRPEPTEGAASEPGHTWASWLEEQADATDRVAPPEMRYFTITTPVARRIASQLRRLRTDAYIAGERRELVGRLRHLVNEWRREARVSEREWEIGSHPSSAGAYTAIDVCADALDTALKDEP